MNIVQLTPGAGAMYCGNCFRDNVLVASLRKMGHSAIMVPLYLPLTLDEEDQSGGIPIFFGGINVYLQQKSSLFAKAPSWLHQALSSPGLLKWAAGKAAKTRAADLGDLTLSMLRGEEGNQARELEELISWLRTQPRPDVICLSNVLLVGMIRRLRSQLNAPVVCTMQGEEGFLDALPYNYREACWNTLAERAAEADLFVAPSKYFADLMTCRMRLPSDRVRVVYNGINLDGYSGKGSARPASKDGAPVLGFFARMCREKGLDVLVEAYRILRKNGVNLRLKIGGSCGPADRLLVEELKETLDKDGFLDQVSFHPNLSRADKLAFLESLTVFSVPATYGEAFGLYVIEALAAGAPVVQPRHVAFPEIVEATGGGVLCKPGDAKSLAEAIGELLSKPDQARALGDAGRRAVFERFSAETMARQMADVFADAQKAFSGASALPAQAASSVGRF